MAGAISKIRYAGGCLVRHKLRWWVLSDTYCQTDEAGQKGRVEVNCPYLFQDGVH